MKNKRYFTIVLTYLFFLTLLPISLISIKANAQESDSSIPSYLNYNPTFTVATVQYKDKSIIIEETATGAQMRLVDNGESKLISGLSSSELENLRHIDGTYNNCIYFSDMNFSSFNMNIYSFDLNSYKLALYKSVNLMDGEKGYFSNISSAVVDNDGVCWFQFDTSPTESNGNGIYTEIIKSTNGYRKVMIHDINYRDKMTLGQDGNIWITNTLNDGSKLYKVSKNIETEYAVNSDGLYLYNCFVDPKSNIYLEFTNEKSYDTISDPLKLVLKQYTITQNKLSLKQELINTEIGMNGRYEMDSLGDMWKMCGDADHTYNIIYKLENNQFVPKYKVMRSAFDFNVYDDNHMVIRGELGYTIISKNDPTTVPAAPQVTPSSKASLSNAGSVLNVDTLAFAGIAFLGAGSFVLLRKRKTK